LRGDQQGQRLVRQFATCQINSGAGTFGIAARQSH